MGFSDEDAKTLEEKFSSKAAALEKGQLRLADYSRNMNALQASQRELQTATDKLNRDIAEWGELSALEQTNATELKARIDKAEGELFRRQQQIQRLAEDLGRDPKEFLGDAPAAPPKSSDQVSFDERERILRSQMAAGSE